MSERPEGVHIALFFISAILIASVLSRAIRSTELRIEKVYFDEKATAFLEAALKNSMGEIRLLPHRHGMKDFRLKEEKSRHIHSIQKGEGDFIFVEAELTDSSEFYHELLEVHGCEEYGYPVLRCSTPAVPNAIAAIALYIRDRYSKSPHIYFSWAEGHPVTHTLRYVFLGEGETASVVREILRGVEPVETRRPIVHVG